MNKHESDSVIVQENVDDIVEIEGSKFSTKTTIGLAKGGDFYLEIDFQNLNENKFKALAKLTQKNERLAFKSGLVKKESYNITHIILTEFVSDQTLNMHWKCFSDDPNLY